MQGKKQFTDQVVTHFRLSERVPPHNLYRRLDELKKGPKVSRKRSIYGPIANRPW